MLAESDKMPTGLKLTTRTNVILYYSTWIAGVTNNNNNNNNKRNKNKGNYPYEDDDEDTDSQENYMDEIDPSELGDLLQDTCVWPIESSTANSNNNKACG